MGALQLDCLTVAATCHRHNRAIQMIRSVGEPQVGHQSNMNADISYEMPLYFPVLTPTHPFHYVGDQKCAGYDPLNQPPCILHLGQTSQP